MNGTSRTLFRPLSVLVAIMALVLVFSMLVIVKPASAETIGSAPGPDVKPVLIDGNKNCDQVAGRDVEELKIDPPNNGTFTDGTLQATISAYTQPGGTSFNWTSDLGVDFVLVKGGPDENQYLYDPPAESKGDDGLTTPINASGKNAEISHISFCYDLELQVSKTAQTSFTRTHNWTINKSVTPATWNLFKGDSGTSTYTVSVDKVNFTDSDWAVIGTITVSNPSHLYTVTVTGIQDVVSQGSLNTSATITKCNGTTPSFPYTLATKNTGDTDTLVCSYSANLPNGDNGTNKATATSGTAKFGNGSGTADVTFGLPTKVVNDSITVDDTYVGAGSPWTFSDDGSQQYPRKFTCDTDGGTHNNTATIKETGQLDGASVTVNCHALTVTKNANTFFTRTYSWTIKKTVDLTEKTIATDSSFLASYSVSVNATSKDSDHKVSGSITVSNLAGAPTATINAVSDVVSGFVGAQGAADVACGVTFPYTLPAAQTLTCTYSKALPDAQARTNEATATLQNHDYDSSGNATGSGTTNFSGSAAVSFANASMNEVDKSITVNDNFGGTITLLGHATYGVDTLPKTFPTYKQQIGPYTTCGDKTVDNTASFVTNDTRKTDSATARVIAHVQCKLTVVKELVPATDTGKFNLLIDGAVKATDVGDGGTTGAQQVALGNHTVSETAGTGTNLSEYVSKINCGGTDVSGTSTTVSFAAGDSDKTCKITNTKKGKVTVKKTTNKVVDPTKIIEFVLTGPGLPAGGVTRNTQGDQDGVLDFGYALIPGEQYTVCENPVPAGFTSYWVLDGVIVTPYNPNATDSPPEDFGVRCYKFSASADQTRAFEVDNSRPGGDPRTIGYWKNWNKCTSGGQATTAAKNGGAAAGFFLIDDLLPQTLSTGGDNIADDYLVTTCTQAVKLLSKQDQSGVNRANDAAYELASQLLATKFNLAAGAETCAGVQTAVKDGQALLDLINFTGSGSYLTKASTNRTKALSLAATLDKYNNGNLCP